MHLPAQSPYPPLPTDLLHNPPGHLRTPDRNRARAARFSVLPAKSRSLLDRPNAMCHRLNCHTNPTARTPFRVCAFICAYRTKTEPTWTGFRFYRPKPAPCTISPTYRATTITITPTLP